MSEYNVRRVVTRFFEYTGDDESTPGDNFNIDATPHDESIESLTFNCARELVEAMRRDGVTFSAGDSMEHAELPDGSHVVNYATAERETVYWDCVEIAPAILDRVIIPAVDGRMFDPAPEGWEDYERVNAAQHAANTFHLDGDL